MTGAGGRILLLGAGGWLGSAIRGALPEAVPVASAQELEQHRPSSSDTIINAAGSKDPGSMWSSNVALAARLLEISDRSGARLVHLGSAAEYGLPDGDRRLSEGTAEHPVSDYGRSKLAATALLRESGRACVLRLFNIAEHPPQPGSPLEEIYGKVRDSARTGKAVRLWSAGTTRDWVTRGYVVESVAVAVQRYPIGVFNVCSGIGVSMGDLATALLERWGATADIEDLHRVPAGAVIGDPTAWEAVSGCAERVTAPVLASLLVPDQEVTA